MISKEEVEKIAKLSRLELTEKEVVKMQKDLSAILDYFDLLKKAPKAEKNKSIYEIEDTLGLREDKTKDRNNSEAERILEQAPDKKDDYIKVKTIL